MRKRLDARKREWEENKGKTQLREVAVLICPKCKSNHVTLCDGRIYCHRCAERIRKERGENEEVAAGPEARIRQVARTRQAVGQVLFDPEGQGSLEGESSRGATIRQGGRLSAIFAGVVAFVSWPFRAIYAALERRRPIGFD